MLISWVNFSCTFEAIASASNPSKHQAFGGNGSDMARLVIEAFADWKFEIDCGRLRSPPRSAAH